MTNLYNRLREWARDYEPAVAKALVTAFLQILVVAGIALGNWPQIIDAALSFVAVAATVLAGRSIRNGVYSPASHDNEVGATFERAYRQGTLDQQALRDRR